MKIDYKRHQIEVTANGEDERWMAVVLIKPSPDNLSYSALHNTIAVWGYHSRAEAEEAGLRCGKEWLN